ncbi:MAG: hypothetical protein RL701_2122 [Pseudomonadota bacterium]
MLSVGRSPFRATVSVVLLAWLGVLSACRDSTPKPTSRSGDTTQLELLELRYQGTNSEVLFSELAEDLGYLAPLKLKWVGNTISGPQDIQTVATGDTDFGGAFNGAIIKLIAAKAPIRAVVGYYGVDAQTWTGFFVTEDSPIHGPRDLIGKKISVNTLGAHSEFMLREYLARGGLTPAEIKQVTLVQLPPVNSEQAVRGGQVDVATLRGIIRDKALERGGLRALFTDHDLFGDFTAGCLVFRQKTLREAPNTVRKFVAAQGRAIEWARTQPRDVVRKRMAEIMAKRKRGDDASIVQHWKSVGIAKPGGIIADSEFQVWLDWLVKDGTLKAGQVARRDVFTNEYSAYLQPTTAAATPRSP